MDIRGLGSRALCSATRNIIVSHRGLENLNTLLLRIYSQNRAHEISALISLTRFSRTSESGRTHLLILTTNSHPFGKREIAPKVNECITSSSRSQHAPILTARSQSVPRLTVKPNVARLTHPELPDLSMDYEKQKDEITALESIYTEEEFSYHEENSRFECTFKIFVNLPAKCHLSYKDLRQETDLAQEVQISYLPPLTLHVTLPEDYPSTSAPMFMLCSSWLYPIVLSKLCRKLDSLWEKNKQEILFTWVEFLQDKTLSFLKIKDRLDMDCMYTSYKRTLEKLQGSQANKETNEPNKQCNSEINRESGVSKKTSVIDKRAILDCPIGRNPIQMLIDYSEKRKQIEFKKNFYTCNICFTDKSGEHCTQFLPCAHTFCKDCIKGYFEVKIKDGNVQNIRCPEEKCKFEATPDQVKDLVSSELFSKYDSLLLSTTLDTMMDIVYCPRRHCQYPVTRDPDDNIARCPVCQYAFCVRCKMVYHGVEPCKISSAEKQRLLNEYQSASNEKKAEMEKHYGKKQLQTMLENVMSENWINDNSHNCPHCKTAIEKSDGCNKMTCSHCGTYFCWLCGTRLNPDAPYLHFRNPESKCFNMLYRGVIPDELDDDDDFDFHAEYLDYYSEDEEYTYDEDFVLEYDD